MSDAKFEDSYEKALQLLVVDKQDLQIISSLLQDAVFTKADIKWDKHRKEYIALFNRFRWENNKENTPPERVRTLVIIRDVISVKTQRLDDEQRESYALLCIETQNVDAQEMAEDSGYKIILQLSGRGCFAIDVDAINIVFQDVTRPYRAVSKKKPAHHFDDTGMSESE